MRNLPLQVHITVRRAAAAARYRLWVEVDGDFGVALARSDTLGGLRRSAARVIRRQWRLGYLEDTFGRRKADGPPELRWHRSTRRYARFAGRELSEIRRRMGESERTVRTIERKLRRAGAYAREARLIARGQVYFELDLEQFRRTGHFEVAPWNP